VYLPCIRGLTTVPNAPDNVQAIASSTGVTKIVMRAVVIAMRRRFRGLSAETGGGECWWQAALRQCSCSGYRREERRNAYQSFEGRHAGSFGHLDIFSISTAQQAQSAAFPDAAGRGTGEYGFCEPPAFRRRITIFRFYPRLQTRRPGSNVSRAFFCCRPGSKLAPAWTLEPQSLRAIKSFLLLRAPDEKFFPCLCAIRSRIDDR
jgi:hypothetical protein